MPERVTANRCDACGREMDEPTAWCARCEVDLIEERGTEFWADHVA